MFKRSTIVGLLALVLFAGTARALEVTGAQVTERVEKVMKAIDWAGPLSATLERAQKEKKLVFWIQIVGELNGGL